MHQPITTSFSLPYGPQLTFDSFFNNLSTVALDKIVLSHNQEHLTGQDVVQKARTLARALARFTGATHRNHPIAIFDYNSVDYVISYLAVLLAGMAPVLINTRWTGKEVQHALAITGTRHVIIRPEFAPKIQPALDSGAIRGVVFVRSATAAHPPRTQLSPPEARTGYMDAMFNIHVALRNPSPPATPNADPAGPHPPPPPTAQFGGNRDFGGNSDFGGARGTDTAAIVFTSGSSGAAKGVRLSYHALTCSCLSKYMYMGYRGDDVYLLIASLSHVAGLVSTCAVLFVGGHVVVGGAGGGEGALDLALKYRVTSMVLVPTMLMDMVQKVQQENANILNHVRTILVGGGTPKPADVSLIATTCPHALLYLSYGMTETCASVTYTLLHTPYTWSPQASNHAPPKQCDHEHGDMVKTKALAPPHWTPWAYQQGLLHVTDQSQRNCDDQTTPSGVRGLVQSGNGQIQERQYTQQQYTQQQVPFPLKQQQQPQQQYAALQSHQNYGGVCVGRPCMGVSVKIGGNSEIYVRGDRLFSEYVGQAHESALTWTEDGWFMTGDRGRLDARGNLWLLGRTKDCIKSGGENVFAQEVEHVLLTHGAVAEVAVVPTWHDRFGEAVTAVVRCAPGYQVLVSNSQGPIATWQLPLEQPQAPTEPKWNGVEAAQNLTVDLSALREHCAHGGLAGFKAPVRALFIQHELPRSSIGKIMKLQCQQLAVDALARTSSARGVFQEWVGRGGGRGEQRKLSSKL